MYGWHGRILHIDLTRRRAHSEPLDEATRLRHIGGRGLALHLFAADAGRDPFDADIPLIFTTGPLSGTATPASERLCILSRSPLTGTVFDTAGGGSFAHTLKASGHDGLVIRGRAAGPTALRITPAGAEFLAADSLWGTTTSACISEFDDPGVAAIGPAGEAGVLYANIVFSDGDNDGRGGLGAVMGHKRLKAIAVSGDVATSIADPARLEAARRDILRLFKASPALFGPFGLREFGTTTFIDLTNQRQMLPTANFRRTAFPLASRLSGPALRDNFAPLPDSCHDCPIACKKRTGSGRLPEYAAVAHFGALLEIGDFEAVITAGHSCRELGLDPISTAATLATAAEISGDPTQPEQLPTLLQAIADRRDSGRRLALGARRLAEELGQPQAAMTVKSLELPAFDPRGATGLALSLCTCSIGGSEAHAGMQASEILRKPVALDRFSLAGKARLVKIAEDLHAAYNSLIVCPFAFYGASLEEYAQAFRAVTGCDHSPADFARLGEQIVNTELALNRASGFGERDDCLPERFFSESGSSSELLDIPPLDREQFAAERRRYYRIRTPRPEGEQTC